MTAPEVSIITPVLRANERYLREAWASLQGQDCAWEWLIETDGQPHSVLPTELSDHPCVHIRQPQDGLIRRGVANTRDRALARARGQYVFALDEDDVFTSQALPRLVTALREHPQASFAFGAVDDLIDDQRHPVARDLPTGVLAPGTLLEYGRRLGRLPLVVPSVLWRRDHLLALGGWPALTRSEDYCLSLAANALWPVVSLADVVLLYRKHPEQTTATVTPEPLRSEHRQFVEARAEALARLLRVV